MKRLLLILASLWALDATAGVYKCTDDNGATVYRATPCNAGNNIQIDLKTGKSVNLDETKLLEIQHEKEQEQQREQERLHQQQEQLFKLQVSNESKKNQQLIKDHPNQFSAYAIPPYEPDSLLPLVKRYVDRLADIERMRGLAAEKALASKECTRVESSELNEKSAPGLLVFLVDCSNAKSLYFNEKELNK